MHVEKITLCGFRCFGNTPKIVMLNQQLTAIIGPNGSGKSAVLHSLMRMFGITQAQRTVAPSDFHFNPTLPAQRKRMQSLWIDVVLVLPELNTPFATPESVAPIYRHMQIAGPGGIPVCRMRLEARWDDDGTTEGAVTQEISWISTLSEDIKEQDKSRVTAVDKPSNHSPRPPRYRNRQARRTIY